MNCIGEDRVLRPGFQIIGLLLLGLISMPGYAVVVKDLYSAEVPVTDHSDRALAAASRDALSEVLVKVSGSVDVLQDSVITEALGNSQTYVQQYVYTLDQGATGDLSARFEFDSSVIAELVAGAGLPFWTANRPAVLVWMVMESSQGREFLNWESAPEVISELIDEFARRGVPVQFPLYDLNDSALISVDELWRLNAAALNGASRRYDTQDILAGRLATLSNGSWVGDWSYLFEHSRVDRSIPMGDPQIFLRAGVSLVAQEMSARYAVVPSGKITEGVKLMVSGVSSYADYANIVAWLEGVELIEFANVEIIRGDSIRLNLVAQADAKQLAAIIELNSQLVPVHSVDTAVQLSYQWQR